MAKKVTPKAVVQAAKEIAGYIPLKLHHALKRDGWSYHLSDDEKKYINSNRFTPEEYIDVISGAYGHETPYWLKENFENHPYNTPENNSVAFNRLLDHHKHAVKDKEENHDPKKHVSESEERIKELVREYNLPEKDILQYVKHSKPDDRTRGSTWINIKKESITPNVFNALANDHGRYVDFRHPAAKQEHVDDRINNNSLQAENVSEILDNPNLKLSDDQIKHIFEKFKLGSDSANKLLDRFTPEKKSELIDDYLGINGGEFRNTDYEGDDAKYDNWDHGNKYHHKASMSLAGSNHLNAAQIEHIKNHGNFDEKIALFENPDIDPAIHNEMFEKWVNDDSGHGYDRDEFKKWIKENHEFNYDDYYNAATQEAQENYTLNDYLRDSGENLYDEDDIASKKEEILDQDYDWTGPNPDFDESQPESEDNPRNINFADTVGYDITDHPEFSDREDEAQDKAIEKLDDDQENNRLEIPDRVYEGYDESLSDDIYDRAQRAYEDEIDNFEEHDFWVPKHLEGKLTLLDEIKQRRLEKQREEARRKEEEKQKKNKEFLDQSIPNRSITLEYGQNQHHLQMAKDYADANNGSIDIGFLNKKYPNMVDKWKKIFNGKGKLTSQELSNKIQETPKTKYNISHGKWDSPLQNINNQHQVVFRLDHSPESLEAIKKDPEMYDVFNKLSEVSHRSGHPVNVNTIGWARVDTSNPKHWMIDEVQSDFSQENRRALEREGASDKGAILGKIADLHGNWREALTHHVLQEAKKHGVDLVSTHSPESKAAHTNNAKVHTCYKDSYHKVPRALGFVQNVMENLPLNDNGIKVFKKGKTGKSTADLIEDHTGAVDSHATFAEAALQLGQTDRANYHIDKFNQHKKRLLTLDPTLASNVGVTAKLHLNRMYNVPDAVQNAKNIIPAYPSDRNIIFDGDASLADVPQQSGHTGNTIDLRPESFKKSLTEIYNLLKGEITQETKQNMASVLMLFQDEKLMEQLKQSNPELATSIKDLVHLMLDTYQKATGKADISDLIEIANQLQNPQQQPQEQGQPESSGAGHMATKDPEVHSKQTVYGPDSERQYDAQTSRTKTPDGEWVSNTGKPVEDATSKLGSKF